MMRRSREEIIADILEAVDNDINRISSIMRNVNLSASLAKKYLKALTDNGLIVEINGEYKLTEKGRRLLESMRNIRKMEVELITLMNYIKKEIGLTNDVKKQVNNSS
ncbi:MAG: winged helix-turn-helix domain-containing protein [Sulfolobaceae archaeon]